VGCTWPSARVGNCSALSRALIHPSVRKELSEVQGKAKGAGRRVVWAGSFALSMDSHDGFRKPMHASSRRE
jgi:hypothetical protein